MTDKDIVIASTLNVPVGGGQTSKPAYLIRLEAEGKSKAGKLFLAIEMPNVQSNFVHAKGFFVDAEKFEIEAVIAGYKNIIASTNSESYVEMWFPWHNVAFIRSLVFKGNKNK